MGRGQRHPPLLPDGRLLHLLPALLYLVLHSLLPLHGCGRSIYLDHSPTLSVHLRSVSRGFKGRAGDAFVPPPPLLPPLVALAQLSLEGVGLVRSLLGQSLGDGTKLGPVEGFGPSFSPPFSRPALLYSTFPLYGRFGGRGVLSDVRPGETLKRSTGAVVVRQAANNLLAKYKYFKRQKAVLFYCITRNDTPSNIWGGGRPDVFHDRLDPVAPYSCGHGGERVHCLLSLWTKNERRKILQVHEYSKPLKKIRL